MSLKSRCNRLLVFVSCVAFAPASTIFPEQLKPAPQAVTVRIRLDERMMFIVPVRVNGSGPYDFVLDTGCSKSIVDRKLAAELRLPTVGEKTVTGVLASASMSVVHADSLSVGEMTVSGGEVFSADHAANVTSGVRGVLGEDFLRNFDVLLDYRHRVLRLESAPGSMAATAAGERLPLQSIAVDQGKINPKRLILSGRIQEFGDATVSLLLDSGTNQLTLFNGNLGSGEIQGEPIVTAKFDKWITLEAAARRIRSLDMGQASLSNPIAITLSRRGDADSDGLLPTSLFHSVFISHLGRFVILNPTFPEDDRGMRAAR